MRQEQAEMLVAKLEAAFNRGLPEDTKELYVEKLMSLPFSTGSKRVDRLICTATFMPRIAEFMRPTDDEMVQMNTNVNNQNEWSATDRGRYAQFRSARLVELDEAAYSDYLHNPAERARFERCWLYEYAKHEGKAS